MSLQTLKGDTNYRCKVVKLPELRVHPNADRLSLVTIDGQVIITGKETAIVGGLYIYFPLECKINADFLSYINGYSSADLNRDNTKKGFFSEKCRVKATKLRGIVSEGYLHPAAEVSEWLQTQKVNFHFTEADIGIEFDTIGTIPFVEKYIVGGAKKNAGTTGPKKKAKRESKLVENQYYIAADTENLKRNIHKISPEDWISISYKYHGCNFSMGRVLCKKPLSLTEKVLKFFGIKIVDSHYDLVYASRRVIKNEYADKKAEHFYDVDVWGVIAEKYKNTLLDGVTIHGEIINQTPTGSWIQNSYDYGLPPNTCDLIVYRIFLTNPKGDVFEFSYPQMKKYCEKMGLKLADTFYYGQAKNLFPELSITEHWNENFLAKLIEKYTEKNCYICKNAVPEEGIILSKTDDSFQAFKLKSLKFLERESKELDAGTENMEDLG